jgi:hypothetical protein
VNNADLFCVEEYDEQRRRTKGENATATAPCPPQERFRRDVARSWTDCR